jgi:hypothetical protein
VTVRVEITLEEMPKRTFATAADWPGWSRSGKTEDEARSALLAYAPRYVVVVDRAGQELEIEDLAIDVVERVTGSAGTEFGVPSRPTRRDARPLDAAGGARLAAIVESAWSLFEQTAAAAPEELRKGPRGGGRNTSKVVAHVLDADQAYANQIGITTPGLDLADTGAVRAMRDAMLDVLRAARDGSPLAGRRWPARYAAHRIAWHALDHLWEIEDRSTPEPPG